MVSWRSWVLSSRECSKVESSDYDEEGKLQTHSVDNDLSSTMGTSCSAQGEQQQQTPITKAFVVFNTMSFALSLWLSTMAMTTRLSDVSNQERNYFLKKTSESSPLLDLIDIPLTTRRMNGTFMIAEPASIFRAPPSPEVDAAWARIETQAPVPITRADVISQARIQQEQPSFQRALASGPTYILDESMRSTEFTA